MDKNPSPLFLRVIKLIQNIPQGQVSTYGSIARFAGAKGCARHVSYILSSSSNKHHLPWHRVLGTGGKIRLPVHNGFFQQKKLLIKEGVTFKNEDTIHLTKHEWQPTKSALRQLLKGIPPHISKNQL